MQLTNLLFHEKYLGGLEEVIAFVDPIWGIPVALNLRCYIDEDEVVPWLPLVSGLKTMSIMTHLYQAWQMTNFFLKIHILVKAEGVAWYSYF